MWHVFSPKVKLLRSVGNIDNDDPRWRLRLQLTNHIRIFFNFAYYLGASPFRLQQESNSKESESRGGYYYCKTWRPQQVVCGFLQILSLFVLISQLRDALLPLENLSHFRKNPTLYFDIMLEVLRICYKMVTFKRLWCNGKGYMKVANTILNENFLPVKFKQVATRRFLYSLYSACILKILSSLVAGLNFVVPISRWTPSWWLRRLVVKSRFIFLFSHSTSPDEAPDLSSLTFFDYALALLTIFAEFARLVIADFWDLFILVFVLTLWTTTCSFADDIQQSLTRPDIPVKVQEECRSTGVLPLAVIRLQIKSVSVDPAAVWQDIYKQFQAIQTLSEAINVALGTQVTWFLFEGLMYYSIHMNTLLITTDNFERFINLFFFVLTFFNLYLAGDIRNQVESVKKWLIKKDNVKYVPAKEAYLVLHEIITKDIGIRGNNAFTITFPLVAGVSLHTYYLYIFMLHEHLHWSSTTLYLSLVVTFFVICVQESDSNKKL